MAHVYNQVSYSACFQPMDDWRTMTSLYSELSLHVLVNSDKIPLNSLWAFCVSNYTVLPLVHFFFYFIIGNERSQLEISVFGVNHLYRSKIIRYCSNFHGSTGKNVTNCPVRVPQVHFSPTSSYIIVTIIH